MRVRMVQESTNMVTLAGEDELRTACMLPLSVCHDYSVDHPTGLRQILQN